LKYIIYERLNEAAITVLVSDLFFSAERVSARSHTRSADAQGTSIRVLECSLVVCFLLLTLICLPPSLTSSERRRVPHFTQRGRTSSDQPRRHFLLLQTLTLPTLI
jgi:hypothetical protein